MKDGPRMTIGPYGFVDHKFIERIDYASSDLRLIRDLTPDDKTELERALAIIEKVLARHPECR